MMCDMKFTCNRLHLKTMLQTLHAASIQYILHSVVFEEGQNKLNEAGVDRMIADPVPRSKQNSTKPLRRDNEKKSPCRLVE